MNIHLSFQKHKMQQYFSYVVYFHMTSKQVSSKYRCCKPQWSWSKDSSFYQKMTLLALREELKNKQKQIPSAIKQMLSFEGKKGSSPYTSFPNGKITVQTVSNFTENQLLFCMTLLNFQPILLAKVSVMFNLLIKSKFPIRCKGKNTFDE